MALNAVVKNDGGFGMGSGSHCGSGDRRGGVTRLITTTGAGSGSGGTTRGCGAPARARNAAVDRTLGTGVGISAGALIPRAPSTIPRDHPNRIRTGAAGAAGAGFAAACRC